MTDAWEARMAARARESVRGRHLAALGDRQAEARQREAEARRRQDDARLYREYIAPMTLAEATERLRLAASESPVWCACIGGVLCCANWYDQARLVRHEAHRVADVVARSVTRVTPPERGPLNG